MGVKPNCLNSDDCILWQFALSPYLKLTGNRKNPKLLIVGESPSQDDDQQEANFINEHGQILRDIIKLVGFDMKDVAFTTIVKCRTTKEWGPDRAPTNPEVTKCKAHALVEIELLKPKVVMLLGNAPLSGILGETGITSKRGRIYEKDGITYIPSFQPLSMIFDPTKMDLIAKDIELAYKIMSGHKTVTTETEYHFLDTKTKLVSLEKKFLPNAQEIFFDLETSRLSPYFPDSYVVCVSMAFREREAFVIPINHSHQIFTGKDLEYARAVLKAVMESDVPKEAQNSKFDVSWLDVVEKIYIKNLKFDTMLSQYLLSEERGTNSLDYMSWQYTDMEGYYDEMHAYVAAHKEADPKRGGSYANVPWSVLVPYSAGDADCGIRVKHVLERKMNEA